VNRSKFALVGAGLAALLGLSIVSYAQDPANGQQPRQGRGQRGQRGQVSLANLPVDTVDKLVKLTPDQKTKVTAIHDKFVEDTKGLRPAQGQQPDPASLQKRRELTTAANQQIEALLTEEQKKKLGEARDEMRLLTAAGAPAGMIGELKLTDDQKKKIAELRKEVDAKLNGLSPEERRSKRRELEQENRSKVEALLSTEQKAQIEKYRKENPQRRRSRP
jgi:Spy/CpxP family protein refolding chaperone